MEARAAKPGAADHGHCARGAAHGAGGVDGQQCHDDALRRATNFLAERGPCAECLISVVPRNDD